MSKKFVNKKEVEETSIQEEVVAQEEKKTEKVATVSLDEYLNTLHLNSYVRKAIFVKLSKLDVSLDSKTHEEWSKVVNG